MGQPALCSPLSSRTDILAPNNHSLGNRGYCKPLSKHMERKIMKPEPFKSCNESCPLFGIVNETPEGTIYGCYIGDILVNPVKFNAPCERGLTILDKRAYWVRQRKLERERDNITTKIYHLQLLIDNCGSE